MKPCLDPTLCHAPANHGVCRARSQCCFPTVFSYVFISTGVKKIVFTGLLKMRRSRTRCAKTRKLQKGKGEGKRGMRGWKSKPCLQCCVYRKSGKVFPPFGCTDLVTVCPLQLHHLVLIWQERKLTSRSAAVAQLLLDLTKRVLVKILYVTWNKKAKLCRQK